VFVRYRGRRLVYFAGCDYFRFASHPAVLAAARTALRRFGLNVAASRVTTGNHPLYRQLETTLARFFRSDRAILVPSGYAANAVAAQALADRVDHAFIDAAAHPSLFDAAAQLRCPLCSFGHADPNDLRRQLARHGNPTRPLVLTDGLFARTGALAPLPALLDLLPPHGWLLVDDAHAAGVLGPSGRGSPACFQLRARRLIRTGTLSKAFGAFGGFVLAPGSFADHLLNLSRQFAGSTPLPPPLAAAALAALRLFARDRARRQRLARNIARVKDPLRAAGLALPPTPAPIVAVVAPGPTATARLQRALLRQGIYPSLIHYPGGPRSGYFRFTLSSEHRPAQLDALVAVLLVCPGLQALAA
jgi:7-keto-8-aminopelargonate synthetase-like enzyme